MSFTTRHFESHEVYCPSGHVHPMLFEDLFQEELNRFCVDCGQGLLRRTVTYSILECSKCSSAVNENWHYCFYCGEKRDAV